MSNIITTDQISFWMNGAGSKRMLSKEEVCLIAKKIQSEPIDSKAHKKAVNKLVSHNLRLVIRSVHLFMNSKTKRNWGDTDTLDFLQVGAMGLIRAAEKYDPTLGYTFATYATFWIRSFISRYAIKTSSAFSIPENACRDAFSFEKHGFVRNRSKEDSEEFTRMVRAAQSSVSIDMPVKGTDITIADTIEREYKTDCGNYSGFSEEITNLMAKACLTDDQVKILEYSFIDDMKVKDIVKITAMTRNQVCNLKKTAMKKLRLIVSPV